MFRLILFLLPFVLLWGGGQELYSYVKSPSATEISCSDYIENGSDELWLNLTDCRLNLLDSIYTYNKYDENNIDELYIPVTANGEMKEDEKIKIILKTTDDTIKKNATEIANADTEDLAEGMEFIANNLDKFFMERDIEGTIEFGISADTDTRKEVEKLSSDLASDYVIIEHNKKTSILLALTLLSIGILLLLWNFASLGKKSGKEEHKRET